MRWAVVLVFCLGKAVADELCCQGSSSTSNASEILAVPSSCPAPDGSQDPNGLWHTDTNAACPAATPNCLRLSCQYNAGGFDFFSMQQFCGTSFNAAIQTAQASGVSCTAVPNATVAAVPNATVPNTTCCQGTISTYNASMALAVPSSCPAQSAQGIDEVWHTEQTTACPSDKPACLQLTCQLTIGGDVAFILTQRCGTTVDAAIQEFHDNPTFQQMNGSCASVSAATVTDTAGEKCCQGSISGVGALSVPSTCPTGGADWHTDSNTACPSEKPNCVQVTCHMQLEGISMLRQLCHTSASDAIEEMHNSPLNLMFQQVQLTCTSAGAWLRPSLLALALSCALIILAQAAGT